MDWNGLNEKQKEAIQDTEGYVRIIAGAGSGKTKVLVNRYLYLVEEKKVNPERILCLTFTRKAAKEMERRIRKEVPLLPEDSVLTYHSFCSRFLRKEIVLLGYPHGFRIYDEEDTSSLLKRLLNRRHIPIDKSILESLKLEIFRYKTESEYIFRMMNPIFKDHIVLDTLNNETREIIDEYLLNQRKGKWLDFDDLIFYTRYLLLQYPDVLSSWQDKYDYLQIDEAQDSSRFEFDILEMISAKKKNLFLVGDPDQNIYEWRNSDNSILVNFDKKHKGTKTHILSINYRSPSQVLEVANALISHNKKRVKKELLSFQGEGEEVSYYRLSNVNSMAENIAFEIEKSKERGEDYKDNVILYRCNFSSQDVIPTLKEHNIPFQVVDDSDVYSTSDGKDILALMRLVYDSDDKAFTRMINKPKRKFGKKKLEYLLSLQKEKSLLETLKDNLKDEAFKDLPLKDFLNAMDQAREKKDKPYEAFLSLLDDSGYAFYLQNLKAPSHLDNVKEIEKDTQEYMEKHPEIKTLKDLYVSFFKEKENRVHESDKVLLMTVHASKGLEFKNVYVITLNEGIFPYRKALEERKDGWEEERRLLYVAITRTKEHLFLFSYSPSKESPFIEELGYEGIQYYDEEGPLDMEEKRNQEKMSLFSLFQNYHAK